MKIFLLPVCFVMITSVAFGQSTSELLADGLRLMKTGDNAAAKAKFEEVLRVEPQHPRARFFIRQIETAKADVDTGSLRRQLDQLTVPEVNFRDASLGSALEFLKQMAKQQIDLDVNFVPAVPAEVMEKQNITLSLKQIPFMEMLRYIGGLADVSFTVDQHAVIVRPASSSEAPSSPAAAPDESLQPTSGTLE